MLNKIPFNEYKHTPSGHSLSPDTIYEFHSDPIKRFSRTKKEVISFLQAKLEKFEGEKKYWKPGKDRSMEEIIHDIENLKNAIEDFKKQINQDFDKIKNKKYSFQKTNEDVSTWSMEVDQERLDF
jgi:seryl-tRNA(Sec) selenium transferase